MNILFVPSLFMGQSWKVESAEAGVTQLKDYTVQSSQYPPRGQLKEPTPIQDHTVKGTYSNTGQHS